MVQVTATTNNFIFTIKGWHRLWAFKSKIIIKKQNVLTATQTQNEFSNWIGWRVPGTQLPWVITAGTYYKDGNRNFWDVCNKKNTIVVSLQNSRYNKLIIEVKNPTETLALLNT